MDGYKNIVLCSFILAKFLVLVTGLFTLAIVCVCKYFTGGVLDSVFDSMKEPVQFCCPAATIGVTEHVLKVGQGLLVRLLHRQSFPQISHIVDALKLCDSCRQK